MPTSSLAGKVMQGALIMLLLRWVTRLLGLISVAITARILTPEDFGIMGTATLVLGLLVTLQSPGAGEVLVRLPNLERSHIDTVWTVRFLMSPLLSVVLFLVAEPVSNWLNEPRVADVLKVLALIPLIEALASPAPNMMARDMAFNRLFYLRVSVKFITVIGTVTLAFALRNYWALVLSQLIAALALVLVTHGFWPYLPKLTLSRIRETGSFTFWSFWRNVAVYLADTVDEFVVRRATGTAQFSHYHVSRDLSRVFITELVAQAAMPLFSAFSKMQDQPERLRAAVTASLGASAILLTPIGLLIYATADSLVWLVLGPQWSAAAPFFQFLALGVAAQTLARMGRGVYAVIDKQHISVMVWGLRAVVMGIAVSIAITFGGPLLVTQVFAVTNLVLTFLDLWLAFRILGGTYPVLILYRGPFVSGLAMMLVLYAIPATLASWPLLDLLVKVMLGGLAYGISLFLFWRLLGRPQGPEQALINRLPERARHLLDKRT
jgi:O-antigen/teichoic acid export membrane protein